MNPPKSDAKTVSEQIEEDRLKAWREKRALIAETSRQERIRQSENDRQKRLEQFAKDKEQRIKDAADKRAKQLAQERAEKMANARSRIAGRSDIDAARKRLSAYRTRAVRILALKSLLFVVLPTVLTGAYLIFVATPLYSSQAQFALVPQAGAQPDQPQSPFTSSDLARQVQLLRQVILSPPTLAALNDANDFSEHFNNDGMNGIAKFLPMAVTPNPTSQFERNIKISADSHTGMITIEARAAEPALAKDFATTVMAQATAWVGDNYTAAPNQPAKPYHLRPVSPPSQPNQPAYPAVAGSLVLAFLVALAAFSIGSIFLGTLLRHSSR